MSTYTTATATDSHGESIFLHAGDGETDGLYTWAEIVATAEEWGTIIENSEPTLTVRHETEDGPVESTVVGLNR